MVEMILATLLMTPSDFREVLFLVNSFGGGRLPHGICPVFLVQGGRGRLDVQRVLYCSSFKWTASLVIRFCRRSHLSRDCLL